LAKVPLDLDPKTSVLSLYARWTGGEVRSLWNYVQEWRFIELAPAVLRARSRNGADQHLAQNGDNLLRVIKRLVDNSPKLWSEVVRKFVERVPGVKGISVEETVDDFLAISFSDETLRSVFNSEWASDGSMQLLATLVLLHEEEPKSLLCVEEPENHVFPTVLNALAEDFELYTRREGDPQVIVTTHSPDFLDGVALESIFWLEKSTGVTRVHRAIDDPQLVELAKVGDRPGALWRQGQFKGTVLP
jgi:predicted ATPase